MSVIAIEVAMQHLRAEDDDQAHVQRLLDAAEPMARRSSIKGDFKLRGVLRRIAALGESDLPEAMKKAADLVLATQQQLIPRDTGEAANALQVKVSKNGLDARIGIIGNSSSSCARQASRKPRLR